ncbi:MAG: esterase/lipase family protein, partial [Thermoanaerobaculia bacterium]
RKVDVISHSAGALVALTWIKLRGGGDRVNHLVMIAPTQRGVIDAFRIFVRPERFLRRRFEPEMVATWPFVYELLPEDGQFVVGSDGNAIGFDVWRPETWGRVTASRPIPEHIRAAKSLREELAASPMPAGISLTTIAGDCVPTATRVLGRDDGSFAFYPEELRAHEKSLTSILFEPGDGTVPISSATSDDSTRDVL